MFKKGMDNKGQISAEYLLLMVIIILILSSVTIPLASQSIDASNNVTITSDAKTAVSSIADAVNVVYANGPGAVRTLDVNIPQNGMSFATNENNITLTTVSIKDSNGNAKVVSANTQFAVNNITTTLNEGNHKVNIAWTDNNYITITVS
ncbi:class III signal peptide-containing protein [Methanobacterium oryzae]|uniref:class III signal peptide-containing protein n=1 Tax=Methanobacterium oryzae TaxID=69540 RepID=UPI003D1FF1F1